MPDDPQPITLEPVEVTGLDAATANAWTVVNRDAVIMNMWYDKIQPGMNLGAAVDGANAVTEWYKAYNQFNSDYQIYWHLWDEHHGVNQQLDQLRGLY